MVLNVECLMINVITVTTLEGRGFYM